PIGPVLTDPDALRHLSDALIRNALEATPPGGSIDVAPLVEPDGIAWRFRDTGRGLTPEQARHLFDPFYCGREAGRGLGLGLPRVARSLQLVGGSIDHASRPGDGATFTARLVPSPPEQRAETA